MSIEVDTILANRYQIRSQLSQKAGRRTFLALDLSSQDLVIIKILRFDADFHWDDLKLFEREAATLKNLNHPAIPKYLDYFQVEDAMRGFALVQTYINAPSLETLIRGRKFSEAEVSELADRVLSILTYLHEQNPPVIHRDIKPSNILLSNRSGNSIGDVYLVDFGSVQTVASQNGGTITIVGSCGYIPLEQFGGQTVAASDLYSLGMTLIYLLTGTHPADLPQIKGQVNFTAEISNRFKRWLLKMTQPYLDQRFDSAKLAQICLKSQDESYGNFTHLKPDNSQVQLSCDREKLEIAWRGTNQEMGCVSWFITLGLATWSGIVVAALGVHIITILLPMSLTKNLPDSVLTTTYLLFILIWVLSIISVVKQLSSKCSDGKKLTINSKHIYLSKCQINYNKSKILSIHTRSQIQLLAYNPGYIFDKYLDNNGTVIRRGKVTVPPKLYLYCGDFEYSLSEKLSQAELWWLGQELSDFLNLELQVIYPTPKVPPAPSCGGGC